MDFYLSLNGRVSLGQYWLRFMLPLIVIYAVLMFIVFSTMGSSMADIDPSNPLAIYTTGPGIILAIVGLIVLWPSIAISVKRLHDIGWTGWLVLLSLVPIASLVIVVVNWFIPGNQGDNKYGPDPRGAG
ncbi:MAG: DUF805 domain-containing protein [Hyphomonadaceae bacterium]|nr:DUF805 domain-containing protein [Hyphomonadaceae bacterium]